MEQKTYYVYIICNQHRNVVYTGVTNNLQRRMYEHRNKLVSGFTSKFNVSILVYYEQTRCIRSALTREKQIKGWRRKKKDALVTRMNPGWENLELHWV